MTDPAAREERCPEFGNEPTIWVCQRAGDYFPHPECPFDCDCDPVRYVRASSSPVSVDRDGKVLIAVSRRTAHYLAGHTLLDVSRVPEFQREARDAAQTALDRDREELEARIVEMLVVTGWPNQTPLREGSSQERFLARLARAVLSAIEGAADKEGGEK